MTVKIITDSACDLPKEIIEEYDVDVIPILAFIDDKEYLDGVTLQPVELLEAMRNGKVPKTAQVPPNMLIKTFLKYVEHEDGVIYVSFSSGLSGTYQTAELMRNEVLEEYPDFDFDIVDSKSASVGFGLLVHKAAQMAKEGKTKDQILKMLDHYVKHIEHIFTVDDIEYLYRGGRVNRTAAVLGNLLSIKPILNMEDGKIYPKEKIRGKKKALKEMLDIMEKQGDDLKHQVIGINHGDDIDGAMKLKEMIEERFGSDKFIINTIGCAIGAHSGPGTLSIFFLNKNYK